MIGHWPGLSASTSATSLPAQQVVELRAAEGLVPHLDRVAQRVVGMGGDQLGPVVRHPVVPAGGDLGRPRRRSAAER